MSSSVLSHSKVLQEVTERIDTGKPEYVGSKGGTACNLMKEVQGGSADSTMSLVRGGQKAFEHKVMRCGERSELKSQKTKIGETYWYGWSVMLPQNWQESSEASDILNQWATFPTNNKNFSREAGHGGCGANGTFITINNNTVVFKLQRQGKQKPITCDFYRISAVKSMIGKWVDFVMQAKWTGNEDGFVKLWMKIGDEPYVQKVDYKGATFWNDEGTGPYFKFGLYKGDPNFKGPAPRILYTDEHRLGDATSTFKEVAPRKHPGERIVMPHHDPARLIKPEPASKNVEPLP